MKHHRLPLYSIFVGVLVAVVSGGVVSTTMPVPAASSTGPGPATPAAAPAAAGSMASDGNLTVSTEATTTAVEEEEEDCTDDLEYANNPQLLERLKKYDVAKVLKDLGGFPGTVNATWVKDVPELTVADDAVSPLPDTDNKTFWWYDYRSTDWQTYVRLEHALVRRKGSAAEYLDVRGEVWWTPKDLCGAMRHATYRRDDKGFVAEVLRAHCRIFTTSKTLSCFGPDSENECAGCISGVSGALLASLVG